VAQIGPPAAPAKGLDFEAAARMRKKLGLDQVTLEWADDFDDPAYSRKVLGLQE